MSNDNIEFRNHQREDSYVDNHQRTNSCQEVNLTDNHVNSIKGHMRQTSSIQEIVDLVKIDHNKTLSVDTSVSESYNYNKRSPIPSILENNKITSIIPKDTIITPSDTIINVNNGDENLLINNNNKVNRIKKYLNKLTSHHFIGICILILCIVIVSVFAEINNSIKGMTRVLSIIQTLFTNFGNDFDSDTFNNVMESFPELIYSIRNLSAQMQNNTNQMRSQLFSQ